MADIAVAAAAVAAAVASGAETGAGADSGPAMESMRTRVYAIREQEFCVGGPRDLGFSLSLFLSPAARLVISCTAIEAVLGTRHSDRLGKNISFQVEKEGSALAQPRVVIAYDDASTRSPTERDPSCQRVSARTWPLNTDEQASPGRSKHLIAM